MYGGRKTRKGRPEKKNQPQTTPHNPQKKNPHTPTGTGLKQVGPTLRCEKSPNPPPDKIDRICPRIRRGPRGGRSQSRFQRAPRAPPWARGGGGGGDPGEGTELTQPPLPPSASHTQHNTTQPLHFTAHHDDAHALTHGGAHGQHHQPTRLGSQVGHALEGHGAISGANERK